MRFKTALRLIAAFVSLAYAPAGYTAAPDEPGASGTIMPISSPRLIRADFKREVPGKEARSIADWVVDSGDSARMPFAIVDKKAARVFVFDARGELLGAAAVLLGIAIGDDSAPGVGALVLSAIRPQDRTTPAGRFEASLGRNYHGKRILWVDYDSAISMHPVINTVLSERRPYRLATPTPLDNRISFGCINVPIPFFEDVVSRAFSGTNGIVYVLPEVRSLQAVFKAYAAARPAAAHGATGDTAKP